MKRESVKISLSFTIQSSHPLIQGGDSNIIVTSVYTRRTKNHHVKIIINDFLTLLSRLDRSERLSYSLTYLFILNSGRKTGKDESRYPISGTHIHV